jgi:hypothetical protein
VSEAAVAINGTAFVAYPGESPLVFDSIAGAVGLSELKSLKLFPWQKMKIFGFKIDDLIRDKLSEKDFLIADITIPNYNVYYEVGYALALEKPVVPIVNNAYQHASKNVRLTGLFDNIGWIEYSNADELSEKLDSWQASAWVERYEKGKNHVQPLFILDTLVKTDFRQYIFQAVEDRSVNFRVFDPVEVPRLTASKAISEISASAGCIIPILSEDMVDSRLNNLRASFLAGLCHGYEIEPLIIQYINGPAPTDFRDFVTNSTSRIETHRHVEDYCGQVLIRNQASAATGKRFQLGVLSKIDLGASAAENESVSLGNYFVGTAEFSRASRSDHALIIGRKGSGKTAIYYQIRNGIRKQKYNYVVELRPSTHNLSELRHELLSISNQGIFDHTIAAFWSYILYTEILLKIREYTIPESVRNFDLQNRIRNLETELELDDVIVSGDFTSRLNTAISDVLNVIKAGDFDTSGGMKTITNLVYETAIPKLRDLVCEFADQFDEVTILIDDIDKGWPPKQLESHDILTIKHLIEALRRIERDLRRKDVKFRSLLFLRGDVYEMLVDNTADRGKYNPITVDWSDQSQLVRLLKQRVLASFDNADQGDEAWDAINIVMPDGHHAVDRLIEASLYRPRFLIEACEKVLSTAINRGNAFVAAADVEHGLDLMSQYLVSDFAYELRDVSGIPEDIFYKFIGTKPSLKQNEIAEILTDTDGRELGEIVDLLLWYGFLGIKDGSAKGTFIFQCGYDFKRLKALCAREKDEITYVVNDAFLRGLLA